MVRCIYPIYTSLVTRKDPLEGCTGFDWDDGNVDKNWDLHRVTFWEAEEVFFNEPLVIRTDPARLGGESRFVALGRTDSGRLLFLSFTVRRSFIRIISARDMTRRESNTYEHTKA